MKRLLQKIVKFGQPRVSPYLQRRVRQRKGLAFGFTLIELLVASLIASILVSVLLSFLIGVLDSDRKETAKSNAQEELQAAISYISDDLQEAIYIYGADALASINSQLPHTQATNPNADCNPTTNTCTPILVFWKRFNYNPNSQARYTATGTPATEYIGCMPYESDTTNLAPCRTSAASGAAYGRDTYTYSLVAYYLKSDVGLNSSTWSNTARILRWELKDGYPWSCGKGGSISTTTNPGNPSAVPPVPPSTVTAPTAGCPTRFSQRSANSTNSSNSSPKITSPVTLVDNSYYFIVPDRGFSRPDFTATGTLSTLAAAWKKFDDFDLSSTGNPFTTLVDFMDDTAYDPNQGGNNDSNTATSATSASAIKIPIGKNIAIATGLPNSNLNCDDPSVGVGNTNPISVTNPSGTVTQRIPADFADTTTNPSGLTSFYACVAPENVTVRIYMRGNALARLGTPVISRSTRTPNANNLSFFPTADVRAFGRSAIGLKKR